MPRFKSSPMQNIQTTLDSTMETADKAEQLVLNEAGKLGLNEDESSQVGMAVRECTVNAIVHGNRYNRNKKVHLQFERSESDLTITIGDEGEGFDINSLPDPLAPENLLRQSGRGLMLARAFMDDFDLHSRSGGGTEVRLVKHAGQS